MKNQHSILSFFGRSLLTLTALFAFAGASATAKDDHHKSNRLRQINLVSDLPGVAALQDGNLVNAWGISFSASSPFWVSATETGRAVLYVVTNDASGAT